MTSSPPSSSSSRQDLLFGVYETPEDHTLRLAATGQTLKVCAMDSETISVAYSDAEVSLDLEGIFPASNQEGQNPRWPRITFDLRGDDCDAFHQSYGLWRRVSWFLLDAMIAWCEIAEMPHCRIDILGGWLAGSWSDSVYIELSNSRNDGPEPRFIVWELPTYAPTPLDRPAPVWRFHQGRVQSCEVHLAQRAGAHGFPILDDAVPFSEQIGDVPRFVCNDGTVLFFSKVIERTGPEYARWGEAGFAILLPDYVLYLAGGRDPAVRRVECPRYPAHITDGQKHDWTWSQQRFLHPLLREEWFFAVLEANALTRAIPRDSLPGMASPDGELSCKAGAPSFDAYLAPISIGLPLPSLRHHVHLADRPAAQPRGIGAVVAHWLQTRLLNS